MIMYLYHLLRTARPRQWLKNGAVFAAPFFVGTLLDTDTFIAAVYAFIAFCALSSGIYYLNDLKDAPKDRLHPVKKNRAIPSGKISKNTAIAVALVLISGSVLFAEMYVGTFFAYTLIIYILLMLSYVFYFRNVIILDSLVIATGFVARVIAGGVATTTSISSWLALATIGISLLLAFGKRRSEKTLLQKYDSSSIKTRETLRHYPDNLLDSMISMSAAYTIITYSLFIFQTSEDFDNKTLLNFLPSILRSPKLMMLTIPFVIYGVARYLYVIYEKKEGESPERVLLSDRPLLFTVTLWGLVVFVLKYLLPVLGEQAS